MIKSKRSSSASPRKSPSSSSAPPSSPSAGSASSPTPASAAGSGSSTARPRCWGFSAATTVHPASSLPPPPPWPTPSAAIGAPWTRATAASSSAPLPGIVSCSAVRGTTSSSGTPSRATTTGFPSLRSTCIRTRTRSDSTGLRRCYVPRRRAAATTLTATAATSSLSSCAPAQGRRSPASTRRRLVHGAGQPLLSFAVTASIWLCPVPLWGMHSTSCLVTMGRATKS
ncbi:hypothetical protein PVAP13_9KG437885 [Panicum virgatum]|uniref:Uncharacterized protein n=1 Tax=Panicum virgatum TaxID=38727 RepID=A0A8T0NRX4_PANVG|nr:hypothetical protein PVAP13_9KG437885 [Panicum virgatum]